MPWSTIAIPFKCKFVVLLCLAISVLYYFLRVLFVVGRSRMMQREDQYVFENVLIWWYAPVGFFNFLFALETSNYYISFLTSRICVEAKHQGMDTLSHIFNCIGLTKCSPGRNCFLVSTNFLEKYVHPPGESKFFNDNLIFNCKQFNSKNTISFGFRIPVKS